MGGFNLFHPFDQSISSIRSAACYQPVPQKSISNYTVIPGRQAQRPIILKHSHSGVLLHPQWKIEKLITRNESHRYMRRMSISVSITRCCITQHCWILKTNSGWPCNKHLSIGAVLLHILCLYLGINFHMQHCFCRPLSIEISEQINRCGPSNI